jgi:hypothetical protein
LITVSSLPQPLFQWTHGFNANESLRDAAAKRGVSIGTAASQGYIQNTSDPLYASTLATEYDLVTAENE